MEVLIFVFLGLAGGRSGINAMRNISRKIYLITMCTTSVGRVMAKRV
jgi:hypothetical protein